MKVASPLDKFKVCAMWFEVDPAIYVEEHSKPSFAVQPIQTRARIDARDPALSNEHGSNAVPLFDAR